MRARPIFRYAALLASLGVSACLATPASAQLVEYYHTDLVGNVRAVTDEKKNVIERHDYLPFGEECTTGACASNPEVGAGQARKFTGKERDTETGLDYFGARYYGSKIGRFTTTDPAYTVEENLVDPQRWNRYAYVRNNPLKYTDPDGKFLVPVVVVVVVAAVYAVLASPDIANAPGPNDPTFRSDQTGKLMANAALAVTSLKAIFPTEGLSPPDQRDQKPQTTTPYKRPSGATTPEQRAAVQGQPCVDCGTTAPTMVADHKTPLVKEHYETGTIDQDRMRQVGAVQPQCPTCSAKQGAELSRYSKEMRKKLESR